MKKVGFLCLLALFLASCGGKDNKVSAHTRIEQYEDSIQQWGGGLGTPERIDAFADRYIAVLLEAYKEEPENPKNPEYLDRVHMWYVAKGDSKEAIKWATKVVDEYPKYENREMVLSSLAEMYDEANPRDSLKVREYYTLILKENPKLDSERRDEIELRLKHNNLSLMDYMLLQIAAEE